MNKKFAYFLGTVLLISVGMFTYAHSQPDPEQDPPPMKAASSCKSGLDAFQKTMFPLVRSKCIACHDSPATVEQGPPHSVSDPTVSYQRILKYLNFDRLDESIFVKKGGNMHCSSYGVDCATHPEDIKKAATAWWDQGQKLCGQDSQISTLEMAIPDTLPTRESGTWKKIRIPLNSLGSDFSNAVFEIEMQRFSNLTESTKGSYRFRKPRLATSKNAIQVHSLRVRVNGLFDARENAFASVDQIVNPKAFSIADENADLPFPVLSVKSLIVLEDQGMAKDKISFGFDLIGKAQPVACKNLEAFQKVVMPVMSDHTCYACHGGGMNEETGKAFEGTMPAKSLLDMNKPDALLCSDLLQRTNRYDIDLSPLIAYPLGSANGHARIIPFGREIYPSWTDWIKSEQSALGEE